jgi:hypothetical protein
MTVAHQLFQTVAVAVVAATVAVHQPLRTMAAAVDFH